MLNILKELRNSPGSTHMVGAWKDKIDAIIGERKLSISLEEKKWVELFMTRYNLSLLAREVKFSLNSLSKATIPTNVRR